MAAYRTTVTIALTLAAVALMSVGLVTARRISRLSDDATLVERTHEVRPSAVVAGEGLRQ